MNFVFRADLLSIFRHIEVLYFCRDGRILPALGQQSFAMIDLEQPNLLRLYNIDEEIRDALKSAVIRIQPHLEQISDANDYSEFRWKDPVWNHVASMISLLFNLCSFEIESVGSLSGDFILD